MQRALAGLHPVAGRSGYDQRLVGSWMAIRALTDAAFERSSTGTPRAARTTRGDADEEIAYVARSRLGRLMLAVGYRMFWSIERDTDDVRATPKYGSSRKRHKARADERHQARNDAPCDFRP